MLTAAAFPGFPAKHALLITPDPSSTKRPSTKLTEAVAAAYTSLALQSTIYTGFSSLA
jgi:hypothetical protein